jgi:hypothetical protein
MYFDTTAKKDRYYICKIGKLLFDGDKQCYAPDAIYRKVEKLVNENRNHDNISIPQEKGPDIKPCIKCKHFEGLNTDAPIEHIHCFHPKSLRTYNLVTGIPIYTTAETMRVFDTCGYKGKLFEPKEKKK